jgi:predicted  nucleic acid-binding Zn-ribbon protein
MEDFAMPDIMEIIASQGVEIPDDKKEVINTELRKTYKHINEVAKINEKLETAQSSLEAANKEIEGFKGLDIEGVKKAAEDWESKYNKLQEDSAVKIADMEYSSVLKDSLANEKFSSTYARDGIMAEIRAKNLPIENGQIMGLSDMLKTIREAQPTAWAAEEQTQTPNLTGAGMGKGGTPNALPSEKEAALAEVQKAMGIKTK